MAIAVHGTAYSNRSHINVIMWDNVNGDNHHYSRTNKPIREQVKDSVQATIKLINPRWSRTYPNYEICIIDSHTERGRYDYIVYI